MIDRLERILSRLPAPTLDYNLDQLEPAVWARIEHGRGALWAPGLRFQLAAAALALVVGMALGWVNTGVSRAHSDESQLYTSYIETGPMARLENGL